MCKGVINKIIELDNNDLLYNNMYNQTLYKDGKIPDELNSSVIRSKIENLLMIN